MKIRIFPESNYKALHLNGNTVRIALDPRKPITELHYPEFYDVKVTSKCEGCCTYCYQSSVATAPNCVGIIDRFLGFFSKFTQNQMPFQIAFGGGEPTSHPDFLRLIEVCSNMGITPNYTTNGLWTSNAYAAKVLISTVEHCGGVAVSTHPHLNNYWRRAVDQYLGAGVHTNLHVIIGDRESIDTFAEVYKEYSGRVKYFVLLPLSSQGRSDKSFSDWEYLTSKIAGSPRDIAFGANFHPYLVKDPSRFKVSVYDPESMSAYLDLETMKVFKSSFSTQERTIGVQ
jgi:sulfatase maturation enzyme AslB (radical SAM superfamily)